VGAFDMPFHVFALDDAGVGSAATDGGVESAGQPP
jgi:hypothetical protein